MRDRGQQEAETVRLHLEQWVEGAWQDQPEWQVLQAVQEPEYLLEPVGALQGRMGYSDLLQGLAAQQVLQELLPVVRAFRR